MPYDWGLARKEKQFFNHITDEVLPWYYKNGVSSYFNAHDGVRLHMIKFTRPANKKAILLSPGRAESCVKYAELIYDLKDENYDVFVIDHRGQGFSERLLADPHKGFVNRFNDYVSDFELCAQMISSEKAYEKRVLLAHSMGTVVGLLYATKNPSFFDGHILSAPMFRIKTKGLSEDIGLWMFKLFDNFGWGSDYIFRGGPNESTNVPFRENQVTTCIRRYSFARYVEEIHPGLVTGAPTNRWVKEAIKAGKKLYRKRKRIKAPTLIFQAGKDDFVTNERNSSFIKKNALSDLIHFEDARHEVLQERDEIRDQAIHRIRDFLGRI